MIIPHLNKVLIRVIPSPEKSGILYIPDAYRKNSVQGLVERIGLDVVDIRIGDYVIFPEFVGTTIWYDDKSYVLISEDVISCRVEQGEIEIEGLFHEREDIEHLKEEGRETHFPATLRSALDMVMEEIVSRPRIIQSSREIGR